MTLTRAQARAAIQVAFRDGWASATPILWENNQTDAPDPPAPYVRIFVRHTGGYDSTLEGSPRMVGLVYVIVCVPAGTGTQVADTLAQSACSILGSKKIGGVDMYAARTRELGMDQQNYYQFQVAVPFEYPA